MRRDDLPLPPRNFGATNHSALSQIAVNVACFQGARCPPARFGGFPCTTLQLKIHRWVDWRAVSDDVSRA